MIAVLYVLASMQHEAIDVPMLDTRHAGLLTFIVIAWTFGEGLGKWSQRNGRDIIVIAASFIPAMGAAFFDAWLALAMLQGPLFVWRGVREERRWMLAERRVR